MFSFGKKSTEALNTCHIDLIKVMKHTIRLSDIDFGISEGHRSPEDQKKYFDAGRSKIDGIIKKGKHNYTPSMACDIYAYINGKAVWDKESITYIAGIIHAVSEILLVNEIITHRVRWGGNWDMDGEILLDQSFDDRPHFELINK